MYKYISLTIITTLFFFIDCNAEQEKFKLITVLYNEENRARIAEYLTCLEINLAHNLIDKIHVVYDVSKDSEETVILNYLKNKKIPITYTKDRPTYAFCFDLANKLYPNSRIILSNADIYFNTTLKTLDNYSLENTFLALTRWDIQEDNKKLVLHGFLYNPKKSCSQDFWIFSTPFYCNNSTILMGIPRCDSTIAYSAQKSGLIVENPCFSIQGCHLHGSNIRNYTSSQACPQKGSLTIPYSSLNKKNIPNKS